jgi:hypothetical protein
LTPLEQNENIDKDGACMSRAPRQIHRPTDLLEAAADQAIATCGGDAREAVKALIVANEFLKRKPAS